ncbi:MAG: Gfa-like protein [Nevskia sp.]|nr:Gfa-like protein [Nevskia sp.]
MQKTYSGSCHCGAVRFEADIDLAQGTNKCNCSLCAKSRAWFAFVPGNRFRLLAGKEALTEYRWTPPGKSESFLHYLFCKICGVRVYAWGEHASMGGVFCAVPVTALDGVDADELATAPVKYVDGLHDRFNQAPQDTRLL